MPDDRAQNLVSTINEALNEQREEDRGELATKSLLKEEILATRLFVKEEIQLVKDQIRDVEVRLTRQIYLVNLLQFLAIVGAVLASYNFLRK